MRGKFLETIKKYEARFGSIKALAVQDKLEDLKEKVILENEDVLEWLPLIKRDITLETLLQKTYQSLVHQMEVEMEEGN